MRNPIYYSNATMNFIICAKGNTLCRCYNGLMIYIYINVCKQILKWEIFKIVIEELDVGHDSYDRLGININFHHS